MRDATAQINATGSFDMIVNKSHTNQSEPMTGLTEADAGAVLSFKMRSALVVVDGGWTGD